MADNMIYRGTTPTICLHLKEYDPAIVDFEQADTIWVTMRNSIAELPPIEKDRLIINNEEKAITFTLTQEETLFFVKGKGKIQIRFKIGDYAGVTKEAEIDFGEILKDGIIS